LLRYVQEACPKSHNKFKLTAQNYYSGSIS